MTAKTFLKSLQVAAIAGVSYYAGTVIERKQILQEIHHNDKTGSLHGISEKLTAKPCLPIFGTISAATLVPADNTSQPALEYRKLSRISEIMKYGYPGMDQILSYSDFVVSYDRRNRVPHWVFEHITPESVRSNNNVDRSKCNFTPDPNVHPFFRADNSDYKRSGFDRGHMAAAGNHRIEQKHCDETFYLSNMAPQVGEGFNRDSWNRLERYVRKLTKDHPNVYICTGPLYLPRKEDDGKMYIKYQVLGANTVAVPTHFFKVIVAETPDKQLKMEAYVMPNQKIADETPLQVFQVRPEVIERAAGLLFFTNIQRTKLASINGKKV
ncbi:unnamed protein product [Hermetia illucens]|uniref:Endonuclease n=1 Tax=Hermetia illucens TaxID=343691 RepID=A0A7R8UB27_HERIL|nr:endonuclease G, mitochondrial [Hermetia illucens]CAD7077497.1 unnamed protein product [Hermetia illucens]